MDPWGLDFAPMEQADPGPEVTNQQANGADKADGNEAKLREIMKRTHLAWA